MSTDKILRKLAKSYKYQSISNGGENGLNCFANKSDYTFYQILFCAYLRMYHTISTDIAEEEVDELVLSDTVYEDAYMYWRGRNKYKKMKQETEKKFHYQNPKAPMKETQKISGFKWDFKSK